MIQPKTSSLVIAMMALAFSATVGVTPAEAQFAGVRQADVDFESSGYVTPAGMAHPSMYHGSVTPVGMLPTSQYQGEVMPVGYFGSSCDAGCDTLGCDGACDGMLECEEAGSGLFDGGLIGKLRNSCCCSCLRRMCIFCRGGGCSACQSLSCGHALGALSMLKPYGELCSQRWYDLSLEGLFLGHSSGGLSGGVTSQGSRDVDPNAPIVMGLGDADGGSDLETGVRLSGALIFGAGGNIEATYMGGHEWDSQAEVFSNPAGTPTLYSFISEFGQNPSNGFDDTDRSLVQSLESSSKFHSAELNYRRRTMGPYCRFQGSWLVGLRYLRFDNGLVYSTRGEMDNAVGDLRFFSSSNRNKNNLFGPQAGFDLWWNIVGGVNLGMGMKGAWMQNDAKQQTVLSANSLGPSATPGSITIEDTDRGGTVMGEFEAKLVYRFSHSWAFRTAYYAIAVDDIAFGTVNGQTIRDFVMVNTPITQPRSQFNSLTVQGFSFGTEYIW